MKVEVWADIICPWCGLGIHRLNAALAGFAHRDQVEVAHRSFQLDPSFPDNEVVASRARLRGKGMTDAQIDAVQGRVEAMAAAEGLRPYVVADNQVGNTGPAHELLAYATSEGRHQQAWDTVFAAYFGTARSVFGLSALLDLAEEIGLDRAGAQAALASRQFADQVEADAREAAQLGATGVPFFVIDRRYAVPGAQPANVLLGALTRAWEAARQPAQPSAPESHGAER